MEIDDPLLVILRVILPRLTIDPWCRLFLEFKKTCRQQI